MIVMITGGTGFLGRRLVAALLASNAKVRALSRSAHADAALAAMGAEPFRGDLAGGPLTAPPCDLVVHAGAHFRLAGPRQPYFRTNVEGTRSLLAAAAQAGARRFVHVSAGAVVMDDHGSALRQVDEGHPTYPDSFSAYIASKAQGEAAVLAADRPGFRTLALRPPGIWGPGDAFSAALPTMLRRRRFAFVGGGRYPYATCHVDNVVEAVMCAARSDAAGRAFFVNDAEPITFRGFVEGIAGALGLDVSRAPSLPYPVARLMGGVTEGLWSLWGRAEQDPPLNRSMVRLIGREFTTSDAAARRDLGYRGRRTRSEGLAAYGSNI